MIFQHCLIVVKERQFGSRVDVESVGRSVVFVVVDGGCVNCGEDLHVRQPFDDARVGEKLMRGLRHVGAMQHVVIRVAMTTVSRLDTT